LAERPDLVEHVFAFDADDKESYALRRMHHIELQPGGGCVAAWNYGALASVGDVVIQLSDDWTPPPLWDKLITERIGDTSKASVLAVSDGARIDGLLCMAICTRAYWEKDWFLFHPRFTGVYSDNWFTKQAYARGCVIEARDLVFNHKHPAFGTAAMDATYRAQNAPERYAQGKAVIEELEQGNDWSSIPGFFNYWPFYGEIVKSLKDGDEVAEIGCWLGRSLIFMAQECKRAGKRVKFYAVDTFKGESNQKEHEATVRECGGSLRSAFEANLERCGVRDMVEIIEGDSAESAAKIADGSLAFCYIDAAHDYESVCKDIKAWRGKVKKDGCLAGHDAPWHEVKRAVDELIPKAHYLGVVWAAWD
jgi:cephalosporin hydroxylase